MAEQSPQEIPLEIRWELAYTLRRLEYGIDVKANASKLWRLCANHHISQEKLLPFVQACLHPDRVLAALSGGKEETPDDKRIAVISCVNNDRKYEECLMYLNQCDLPDGMELEPIAIYHAESITSGYQEGMQSSRAKYKIYIHQDLCVVKEDALQRMLRIFVEHPEVGMIGFAGCSSMPKTGRWYETEGQRYGVAVQAVSPDLTYSLGFLKTEKEFEFVEAIDGIFMMTQYDLPWRSDLFHGWHFYDISQSMEFRKRGYRIVVPGSGDIWCVHDSPGFSFDTDPDYNEARRLFLDTYQEFL